MIVGKPEGENALANEQTLLLVASNSEGYEFPQMEQYGGIVMEAVVGSARPQE
jgi:hypothetical protein